MPSARSVIAEVPTTVLREPAVAVLEARGLAKYYNGVAALEGFDLAVAPGEVFCLLGANGAGKTTTIHLFLGFIEPTAGEAYVDGICVATHPLETKRALAYIPEHVMLYGRLSGVENLEYFASLGTRHRYARRELIEYLTMAGLPAAAADRQVREYSKGMRQKVGIAIALAKNAKALLLDEPTSGLDPKAAKEFSALVRMLRDRGAAILMATHDLFRAKEDGTRLGIMKHGHLVRVLRADEIGHTDLERVYLQHMRD